MSTQTYIGTLYIQTCCHADCGLVFGMPVDFDTARRRDHKTWYCPRGHGQSYTGKSDLEKERERAERAERNAEYLRTSRQAAWDQAGAAERSARAYRGHLTRLRNRIAAGVCPVQSCRRNFTNVKAHIASQHPEWAHDHPDALAP